MDMVGVNGNSNTNINIYHGKANGTFELKTTLAGSGEYYKIFLKQLNADNIPDIVAVSNISGIVYLSGPSGYVSASLSGGGFFNTNATLSKDFNNDGILDLLIKDALFINNNQGTFTWKTSVSGNGGAVATDFNNDNFIDIVKTNPGNGTILFYSGKGDGTFDIPVTKIGTGHEAIAHDLNKDGLVDIIVKGYNGEIIIFYNDAGFSFSQVSTLQLGHNFYSVINVFDIDHDGTEDFVTSNDQHIQYRPILPDGSFGNPTTREVGIGSLRGLIVKDAVGEAFPDMIVMSGLGKIRIYTDKLNATLEFTKTEKVYDGLPFDGFYQADHSISSTSLLFHGHVTPPEDVGVYPVTVTIVDPNYEGELMGTVSITKKTLTVDIVDASVPEGNPLPAFAFSYTGFVQSENSLVLAEQPVASTVATIFSQPGEYIVTISGGEDENYVFDYKTGILTVEVVTGISTEDISIDVFPNPARDKISIRSPEWISLTIYDMNGSVVISMTQFDEQVSLLGCESGLYVLHVVFRNGNTFKERISVY